MIQDECMEVKNKTSLNKKFHDNLYISEIRSITDKDLEPYQVLSLDCFDTLLFRKLESPADLFYELQHVPAYQRSGLTPWLRISSESSARKRKFVNCGSTEVTLKEIYQAACPGRSDQFVDELVAVELSHEQSYCYCLPVMTSLMERAHKRGLRIIIVSDTYFNQHQLELLLKSLLPEKIFQMIDFVFPSSVYGCSKSNGLFDLVLKKIQCGPANILHIGDNKNADFLSPQSLGIHACHLKHLPDPLGSLGLGAAASMCIADGDVRALRPLTNLFHGMIASLVPEKATQEFLLGFAAMGPLMYIFSHYILERIHELESTGRRVVPLFLMRDAHLPMKACQVMAGREVGSAVFISRFTAWASSFRSLEDIEVYLSENIASRRFAKMAKQMLLPENVVSDIDARIEQSEDPVACFVEEIHRPEIIKMIFLASAQFRKNLFSHILRVSGCQSDDILLFVDLGYSGTVQRIVGPVIEDHFNVSVEGCYLIQLPVAGWQFKRSGLLNAMVCDQRILSLIVHYVAVIEQLCTSSQGSVIQYQSDGIPICDAPPFSQAQYAMLDQIQDSCLSFVKNAPGFFESAGIRPSMEEMRDTVVAGLMRMIFFPEKHEIDCFRNFRFDLNVGTEDTFEMVNPEKAVSSLIRMGSSYFCRERQSHVFRTNTPAELRNVGLDQVMLLLIQQRFMLDTRHINDAHRRESVNVIYMKDQKSYMVSIDAIATFDGYYALHIPMWDGSFQAGILFGKFCHWFQIAAVELISSEAFMKENEAQLTIPCRHCLHMGDGLVDHGNDLFECKKMDSFMMVAAAGRTDQNHTAVARIVYRPLIRHEGLPCTALNPGI